MGNIVGDRVGCADWVGIIDGSTDGCSEGLAEGCFVGEFVVLSVEHDRLAGEPHLLRIRFSTIT